MEAEPSAAQCRSRSTVGPLIIHIHIHNPSLPACSVTLIGLSCDGVRQETVG